MAQRTIKGLVPRPAELGETAVYRFFDDEGQLLYVGMSDQPIRRWYTHTERKWWRCAATYEVTWYDTREKAAAAESWAIVTEEPKHNVYGTRRHREVVSRGMLASHARRAALASGAKVREIETSERGKAQ